MFCDHGSLTRTNILPFLHDPVLLICKTAVMILFLRSNRGSNFPPIHLHLSHSYANTLSERDLRGTLREITLPYERMFSFLFQRVP